ncbi:hypothetical protein ACFVW2_33895 [Streptomyces sp. NPDC058171]
MPSSDTHLSYLIAAGVLSAALVYKTPAIVRFWRDKLLRAVGGLLVLACGVFFFANPRTIVWLNDVTGVPNVSAPWVYTLLTAFCASCLVLLIVWKDDDRAVTRRSVRCVTVAYATVIVGLWILFALADVPDERVQDLDTHYATTPFIREVVILYLLAHTVAVLITSYLIWSWQGRLRGWLRSGVVCLGVGYGANLGFDTLKWTAVVARWTGGNLDHLSTTIAPPVACVSAVFIGAGFILPHAGQAAQGWWHARTSHWRLRPLYRLLKAHAEVKPSLTVGRSRSAALALTARETYIGDEVIHLGPHIDYALWRLAHHEALHGGAAPEDATGIAGAVTLLAAIERRATRRDGGDGRGHVPGAPLGGQARQIARALRSPDLVAAVRARVNARTESVAP